MRIYLTEKLAVNEDTVANICSEPFKRTVSSIKAKSRRAAARKFAKHHRMVLTIQTLPDDIYKLIPKSDSLHTIDKNQQKLAIEMGSELPRIEGLIGSAHIVYGGGTPLAKLEDVIACHPKAAKEWRECEPIGERGKEFATLVKDYLNKALFTTPIQLVWSAPELVACLLHIEGTGSRGGRRNSGKEIFLARLNERRYIDRTTMRRPKTVCMMPDTLMPFIGEAKLLHTALQKSS